MNCKQGDLAIRISAAPNSWIPLGAVIEVVEFLGETFQYTMDGLIRKKTDAWIVSYQGNLTNPKTGCVWTISDKELRPLSDNPGQDETLTWAPVPKKVEA